MYKSLQRNFKIIIFGKRVSTKFYYYTVHYYLEIVLKQRVSNNIYNNQYNTIEITICSTPDTSVLYQYKTVDYDKYIS